MDSKKKRVFICGAIFLWICIMTLAFLHQFTDDPTFLLGELDWERVEIVNGDELVRSLRTDLWEEPALAEGESFRFVSHLPEEELNPAIYDSAFLLFETGGMDVTVLLDGEEYYRSSSSDEGQNMQFTQCRLTLPPSAAGKELTMLVSPKGGPLLLFPPYVRITSEEDILSFHAAINNTYALPAGAFAFGFVLICLIFIIGVAMGDPDWSLLLLASSAAITTLRQLNEGFGYYFFSYSTYRFISGTYFPLLPTSLLILYLLLNRKRSFWRRLGTLTLYAALVLDVCYLISRLFSGGFSLAVRSILDGVSEGYLGGLLSYIGIYLLLSCGCIAAGTLLQSQLKIRSDAQALALRNQLIQDNYHTMERTVQNTSALRHEWKNQLAALHLLAQKGDLEELRSTLSNLDKQMEKLSPRQYSRNFAVDAILRNAAARAEDLGIAFSAIAPLPEELPIEEADLCSFLINLLDNAIVGASHTPPGKREVECSLKINQGYLAVSCENSYAGLLKLDERGKIQTTKPERENHGFGLMQMRSVAKKYGGALDVSYTEDRFTVQAAMRLKY